ncbi:MAG: cobalt-precorrin-5B (C(1))-methyltransferase CbiD [Methanobacteriaceae archaeon]|nr:cobalt-precorrin-5B (C(1))-methyltransferase CbiD [Methanobacteriaceae archaeon]
MKKNGLKPEISVTTGSLATAAALASLKKLLNENKKIENVNIVTPTEKLNIIIKSNEKISSNKARSICIKYPYNDPDVTVGLDIIATVELKDKNDSHDNIKIVGGEGIGIITKPGLQIPPGEFAINPVPRQMIKKNLEKILPKNKMAIIEINIPEGKNIAKRTMNPRLGIINGISILGTTGIARSMDNNAYKNSIVTQIDVAIAEERENLVFVPGNIGEKLALKYLTVEKEDIIQTGNFIGFMFEEAKKRGINSFTLFGHIGKLVKVAGGIFNTKHSVADCRCEIFAAHSALAGAKTEIIKRIFEAKTTEEILDILKEEKLDIIVLNSIANAIKDKCLDKFDLKLDVMLIDMNGNILNNNHDFKLIK